MLYSRDKAFILTCFVSQPQLPTVVSAPAQHGPGDAEGEALLSPCCHQDQGERRQTPQALGRVNEGLTPPQTQLAPGVPAPCVHLTTCGEMTVLTTWQVCLLQTKCFINRCCYYNNYYLVLCIDISHYWTLGQLLPSRPNAG